MEKHQNVKKFKCSSCKYRSNRKHDMSRHMLSKHPSLWVVKSLLESLISTLVDPNKKPENETANNVDNSVGAVDNIRKIFPYERIRNERVAAREAEFKKLFPNFEGELRGLKVKKVRMTKERRKVDPGPSRRSSRLHQAPSTIDGLGDKEVFENIAGTSTMDNGDGAPSEAVDLSDRDAGGDAADDSSDEVATVEISELGLGDINPPTGKIACLPCAMQFR